MADDVKLIVAESISNALINGYGLDLTDEELALDLMDNIAALEGKEFDAVLKAVKECRTKSG